ncbi:hypothetical protein ACQJBY_048437 [Aegilops geniculata]
MRFMAPLAESFMKIAPGEGRKDMRVAEPRPTALGKPSSMKIKPWKGPLPKVNLSQPTLSKFFSIGWMDENHSQEEEKVCSGSSSSTAGGRRSRGDPGGAASSFGSTAWFWWAGGGTFRPGPEACWVCGPVRGSGTGSGLSISRWAAWGCVGSRAACTYGDYAARNRSARVSFQSRRHMLAIE